MFQRLASAALAASLLLPLSAAPAFAGASEVSYLQGLVGNWTGSGEMTGEQDGKLKCRLAIKPSGEKLTFNGRCSTGGAAGQTFAGTIMYDDGARKYVTSSKEGAVAGKQSGEAIVFVISDSTTRGDITSTMTMSPQAISVEFSLVSKTGKESNGSVPFTKT